MPAKSAVRAPRNSGGRPRPGLERQARRGVDGRRDRLADLIFRHDQAAIRLLDRNPHGGTGHARLSDDRDARGVRRRPAGERFAEQGDPVRAGQSDRLHAEIGHAGDGRDDGGDDRLLVAGLVERNRHVAGVVLLLSNSNVTVEDVAALSEMVSVAPSVSWPPFWALTTITEPVSNSNSKPSTVNVSPSCGTCGFAGLKALTLIRNSGPVSNSKPMSPRAVAVVVDLEVVAVFDVGAPRPPRSVVSRLVASTPVTVVFEPPEGKGSAAVSNAPRSQICVPARRQQLRRRLVRVPCGLIASPVFGLNSNRMFAGLGMRLANEKTVPRPGRKRRPRLPMAKPRTLLSTFRSAEREGVEVDAHAVLRAGPARIAVPGAAGSSSYVSIPSSSNAFPKLAGVSRPGLTCQ